jgi:replicative DNA helicase
MIDELDLKILKGITTNKVSALSFIYGYNYELFDEDTQRFAKLVLDYTKSFKSPPTKRTLLDRHSGNPDLQKIINQSWSEIDEIEYDDKEYSYDLSLMKERYKKLTVEKIKERVDAEGSEDPEKFYKKLNLDLQRLASVELARTHKQMPVGDYIEEFEESLENRKLNPESIPEIKTGYSMIDSITGGIAPGELWMAGGESNSGKSQILNNFGRQLWMQGNTIDTEPNKFVRGYNILYFSLEMPYEDCFVRFLASVANVPSKSLIRPDLLTTEEISRLNKAKGFIKAYQDAGYYFDIVDVPRNLTIQEVELRYNDALLRYRPDIVIVDYMGLMHSLEFAKEQDWLRMGAISASLHEFARAYDCAVVTAAQLTDLKRNTQKNSEENKRVGMHRWGRSSLIMHHVNVGIQIETRPSERMLPDMKLHVVKNRKGPLGEGSIIKNFANALLIDIPYDERDMPKDVTDSIPDLIKQIQEQKNSMSKL